MKLDNITDDALSYILIIILSLVMLAGLIIGAVTVESFIYIECNETGAFDAHFSNNSIICEVVK